MKKIIGVGLSALLLVGMLSGCNGLPFGKEEPTDSSMESSTVVSEPEQAEPAHMGLLQSDNTPVQNELREAFLSRLEEWGYDESRLTVDYRSADGNTEDVKQFCKEFAEDGAQVVVVLSAEAAETAEQCVDKETTVIAIGDKVQLKSGVQQTLALALQVDPELKTLGLVQSGKDSDAKKEVLTYCEAHEIELIEVTLENTADGVTKAVGELTGKVSAFYTLPGAVSEAQAEELATAAKDKALAWYAGDWFLVQKGAFAAVTPDLTKAGFDLADRMVQVMLGQEQDEPVTFEADCTTFHQQTMSMLGLSVPNEILEGAAIYTETNG